MKAVIEICRMYKFVNLVFFCCLLLTTLAISSCEQDESIEPAFKDLSYQFLLLDTNGVVTTSIVEGSDIVFHTEIENTSGDTMYLYFLDCVINNFRVYQNDTLVGQPQPDNWACTDDLIITKLFPHEIIKVTVNWLQRPENVPLTANTYMAKHNFEVSFPVRKGGFVKVGEVHKIELEKEFSVN